MDTWGGQPKNERPAGLLPFPTMKKQKQTKPEFLRLGRRLHAKVWMQMWRNVNHVPKRPSDGPRKTPRPVNRIAARTLSLKRYYGFHI